MPTLTTSDRHPNFRVLPQGIVMGAGWTKRGETSGKDYVSLSLAAPEFGRNKLSADLDRSSEQDEENILAVIGNLANEFRSHGRA